MCCYIKKIYIWIGIKSCLSIIVIINNNEVHLYLCIYLLHFDLQSEESNLVSDRLILANNPNQGLGDRTGGVRSEHPYLSPLSHATSCLLLSPTSLRWDFTVRLIHRNTGKQREPHLHVSLNMCPLIRAPCVQHLQEQEKRGRRKDRQRRYPRPVISIGWAQVPSGTVRGWAHTNILREIGRKREREI